MPETSELNDWGKIIDRLPFLGTLKRDLTSLRRMLYDRRPLRVAALGRLGSGRSTLANALLSAQALGENPFEQWVSIDASGRKLDWIELGDDAALSEPARRAIEEKAPDLVLAVIAVDDAEGGARAREAVRPLIEGVESPPKLMIAMTKCDSLGALEPPHARPTSLQTTLTSLRTAFADLSLPDASFCAVAAPSIEGRWNVSELAEQLLERAPEAAQIETARAFEISVDSRRKIARTIMTSFSAIAVTIGLMPVPFADAILLMPLQAAMVSAIAYLSGRPLDMRAAGEWIAGLGVVGGAGFGLRWGAQQIIKFFPAGGSLVSASIAGAGTLAMGRSAIAYFIEGPGRLQRRPELLADAVA